jgi:type IV pilus assembly protein PilC
MPQIELPGTSRVVSAVSGVRAAVTRGAPGAPLQRQQATPARVALKRAAALPKQKVKGKVNARELSIFTRQFSVMIDAGLPLVQCLDILAGQQANKAFTEILRGVRKTVEGRCPPETS